MPISLNTTGFKYKKPGTDTYVSINAIAAQKFSNKKWTVVGDSLTTHNTQSSKLYCDYIAESTGITVHNMGVSGSGYARYKDTNKAFFQRAGNVPTDSDAVTFFGSFNDLTYIAESGISLGTATDTGTSTIAGCINTAIDNLFTAFPLAPLGIVSPTPWKARTPTTSDAKNYVSLLETICKNRGIPFLNLFYESNLRPWDDSYRNIIYDKDSTSGVHPNETGHKLIAPRFEAFLEKLIL